VRAPGSAVLPGSERTDMPKGKGDIDTDPFNCEGKIRQGRDQARYIHRKTLSDSGPGKVGSTCWATSTAADSPGFNRSVRETAQMVRVPIPSLRVNLMLCLNTR
jgi:hypothetical protein